MATLTVIAVPPCLTYDDRTALRRLSYGEATVKIEYDKEVDAIYIRIQEKEAARTEEISEGVNVDFDSDGRLIGLEVLSATKSYSLSDIFNLSTENLILENR